MFGFLALMLLAALVVYRRTPERPAALAAPAAGARREPLGTRSDRGLAVEL